MRKNSSSLIDEDNEIENLLNKAFKDIMIMTDLLSKSSFPQEKLKDIPDDFFKSPIFCLKVLSFYNPPIHKIPTIFFQDPIFLMEIAEKYPYNLKNIDSSYITPSFINWYINNSHHKKDYLKYLPLEQLTEELAIKIITITPNSYSYIQDKFTNLEFFKKLPINKLAKIYSLLPESIRNNKSILADIIVDNPQCYEHIGRELNNPLVFKDLVNINPLIYKYSSDNIRNNFNCALLAISQEASLLQDISSLSNDLEFFIACHNSLHEKIYPYLKYFSGKIYSDPACVNLVLDNLIESKRIHLLQEPVISDPEIMFKVVTTNPQNYKYIGIKLQNNIAFFNHVHYGLKEKSANEPLRYIYFQLKTSLIENIPEKSLDDIEFIINLFETNKDDFTLHIFPIISKANTPLIQELKEVHTNATVMFDEYFSKFKHQKELEKKLIQLEQEKELLKKEKSSKKI